MDSSGKLFSYDNFFSDDQMKIGIGEIIQISELSLMRGAGIDSHRQKCDEITYAVSGSAVFLSEGQSEKVSAGQIHFIKKGLVHKITVSPNENFRYLCIGYNPDQSSAAVNVFYKTAGDRTNFVINDNGTVKSLSEMLINELYNSDEYSRDMINHYISQILITLARIIGGKDFFYREDEKYKSSGYAMYKLLRYIDREYLQITDIKSVAETVCYSEYYLSHIFKEKMGMTIKEYIMQKKIAYAAKLLSTADVTIEQITDALNFSCAQSFRRAFKRYTSYTPSEYKELNKH